VDGLLRTVDPLLVVVVLLRRRRALPPHLVLLLLAPHRQGKDGIRKGR